MGVTVNLPNTLANNTTADAGQMMADLTALVNGLANAANTGGDTFTGDVSVAGHNLVLGAGRFDTNGNWRQNSGAVSGASVGVVDTNGVEVFTADTGGDKILKGAFGNLLQALSGGYKKHEGTTNVSTGTASGVYTSTVTFPTAFSATPIILITSKGNTAPNDVNAPVTSNESATGFTIYLSQTDATARVMPVSWIALGT